jgi:hypothetical protein
LFFLYERKARKNNIGFVTSAFQNPSLKSSTNFFTWMGQSRLRILHGGLQKILWKGFVRSSNVSIGAKMLDSYQVQKLLDITKNLLFLRTRTGEEVLEGTAKKLS